MSDIEDYKTRQEQDLNYQDRLIPTQNSQAKRDELRLQQGDDLQFSNVNKHDLKDPMGALQDRASSPNQLEQSSITRIPDASWQAGVAAPSEPVDEQSDRSHKVHKINENVNFEVKPMRTLQKEEKEGLRPISVELIPQNIRLRSSFHNLIIIPINDD